jgi:hypothetical protein
MLVTVFGITTASPHVPRPVTTLLLIDRHHDGTTTDPDAADAADTKLGPDARATAENVYAVPGVRVPIVHEPLVPLTSHVAPPGLAVTRYDDAVGPTNATLTVTCAD